jgi:hypothetical protein
LAELPDSEDLDMNDENRISSESPAHTPGQRAFEILQQSEAAKTPEEEMLLALEFCKALSGG